MRTVTMLAALSVMAAAIAGCATTSKGASRAEEVLATMAQYRTAMKAGDVDGLVAFFSDDWESNDGATKEVLQPYFQGLFDQGNFAETVVNMDECVVEFDGDLATMGPVKYEAQGGVTAYEYEMQKEADGVWRCVYSTPL